MFLAAFLLLIAVLAGTHTPVAFIVSAAVLSIELLFWWLSSRPGRRPDVTGEDIAP